MKKTAPYGSWSSDITTSLMTAGTVGLSEARLFGGTLYWLESRPQEQGRTAILRLDSEGEKQEVIPSSYSCRSRVHEYGGACYLPTSTGLYFVNFEDQQLYCVGDKGVEKLTDQPAMRFADLAYNSHHNVLVAVCEEHIGQSAEPANRLVAIDPESGVVSTLHEGQDFYASASFSNDGKEICWLSWAHPEMPWDGTSLWCADFTDGELHSATVVAGGVDESVVQPEWSPSDDLFFVSDRSNWWNIYKLKRDAVGTNALNVCAMEAEFGSPQWQFGMTRYGFIANNTILASYSHGLSLIHI